MDRVSPELRSRIMSAIRSKHTKPEMLFRAGLRRRKIPYRLHYGKERIDVAIPSAKVAVFIDGCFWHGCPRHGRAPKSNKAYWLPKLRKNRLRDKAAAARLKVAGWTVLRFWEHDVNKKLDWCLGRLKSSIA